MLLVIESKKYQKSLKLYLRHKSFSIAKLEKIILLIQRQVPLDPAYRDHKLKGKLEGARECHIYPNVLLMYKILEKESALFLINIGSHPKLL
ncbi:hypothetical protein A2642_04390 [Candidatus Nomurabacteria bacterium RIFCSPHIGHO2_01_FULL_39_10]|uniref:Addiction module toxin RelE n=1 Tax=Candidatus Nomurabacteria bacterium RIFCSPHIGHO2_01_FULL_39_10 TaxID=1801733 RepID=A0A1F6V3U1_9BACT|nr:MAG: hypothetical protein A2642_04390 [Candidatus Nomurabacteria bacterium RIFCSPHIGHO2_01_FULL_39_10]